MTGDVTDHHAGPLVAQLEKLIEVATYALRRNDSRGDFRLGRDAIRRRQQLHLQVVGEVHLLKQALSIERCADEPRVLNRGTDLGGDCRHELLVTGSERLPRPSISEIHYT